MADLNVIGYQIKAIETLEFSLFDIGKIPLENKVFTFNFSLEHAIDFEMKVVAVICTLNVSFQEINLELGKLKTACIFEISNFESFISQEPLSINFPEAFIKTLNSITISTIRGVAYSLFKGTFLQNAILPIIDPNSLVPSTQIAD